MTAKDAEGLPERRYHGGPHRFVDGVCSCGAREHGHPDEVELMRHPGCRLQGGVCDCGDRPCAVELREKGDKTTDVDLNLVDESGDRP